MKAKTLASGLVPLVLFGIMAAYVLGPGSDMLKSGVPLPELSIERVDFAESEIRVSVRNTGPADVNIALADINDRIQPSAIEPDAHLGRYESATVRIPFEWNEAEPYTIGITTDDGTRFARLVDAASPVTEPSLELVAFFGVVGTYVGIIPVMIGLAWLPFIRRIPIPWYRFFLALTAGLLFFLAADSLEEALDIADELAQGLNGALLILSATTISFLVLYYSGESLMRRAGQKAPALIALVIAIGVGLHNFGEGLAIGAAVGLGSVAFSSFLIVGFALHNTTEGIAIASPLAKERPGIRRLAALGLIAGSPAIFGAWAGGFAYSPIWAVVFLGVGAGAIFQILYVLLRWMYKDGGLGGAPIAGGIAAGMLIMYATSILV